MNKICFDRWVGENNVDTKLNYSKGWWEHIQYIRRIAESINANVFVVDTYQMGTPPPEEVLTMPIVLIETDNFDFYVRENFSYCGFYDAWLITVNCKSDALKKDISGLINPIVEKPDFKEGFVEKSQAEFTKNNLIFDNYSKDNNVNFTGLVSDEWDLYALIKFITI